MTFKIITENTQLLSQKEKITLQRLKLQIGTSTFETPKREYYEVSGTSYEQLYKSILVEAAKVIKKTESGEQAAGEAKTFYSIPGGYTYRYGKNKNIYTAYSVG